MPKTRIRVGPFRSWGIVIALGLVAVGCGGSNTQPSPTVINVQGLWRGNWAATSCTATISAECEFLLQIAPQILVSLHQDGNRIGGFISFAVTEANVSGTITTDNALELSGAGNFVPGYRPVTVSNFHATVVDGSLIGTFVFTMTGTTAAPAGATTTMVEGTLRGVRLYSTNPDLPI